jgi:hypothetical protein
LPYLVSLAPSLAGCLYGLPLCAKVMSHGDRV